MRFLADMGISMKTILWLRERGHDAVHLREQGLQRLEDPDIIAKAQTEGRIVMTMDLDFGYLLAISRANLPSVIQFRLSDERSEMVNARFAQVLEIAMQHLEAGAIISVNEKNIRVRQLPVQQKQGGFGAVKE